ncbi:hypothetical protein TgHK011_001187 [Trichoderma gracile]|nr:hypothetical protein TgHK011_001187 [Trichoderma gracile]
MSSRGHSNNITCLRLLVLARGQPLDERKDTSSNSKPALLHAQYYFKYKRGTSFPLTCEEVGRSSNMMDCYTVATGGQ